MVSRKFAAFAAPLAVLAVGLFSASQTRAETTLYATLTNAGEVPPTNPTLSVANGGGPRPASFGNATFVINDAQTSMTMTVTVFNLDFGGQTPDVNDDLKNAHIHASPTMTSANTVGVVWGFFGSPFNDNNPNDQVVTPFTGGQVGGTITGKWDAPEGNGTTFAAQLNNLLTAHAYINFHTTQFGGGEIRGTIVPEPTTAAALLALLGFPVLRRRRSR